MGTPNINRPLELHRGHVVPRAFNELNATSCCPQTAEGDGNEQKHYVKANLGEKNKLYFNKEVSTWGCDLAAAVYAACSPAVLRPLPAAQGTGLQSFLHVEGVLTCGGYVSAAVGEVG